VQAAGQFAFGGTRRSDQQAVFAGQGSQKTKADDAPALDQTSFECLKQARQAVAKLLHGESRLIHHRILALGQN